MASYINATMTQSQKAVTPTTATPIAYYGQGVRSLANTSGHSTARAAPYGGASAGPFILQNSTMSSQGVDSTLLIDAQEARYLLPVPQPHPLQQNQPSAIVKQLSDKVSSQAERLTALEAYKNLLEKRLLDFDPKHPLPVLPTHIGLTVN